MTLLGFVPDVPDEIRGLLNQSQRKEFARWTRLNDMLIRRYGAMQYLSCEQWDSAHKAIIKNHIWGKGSSDCVNTVVKRV